MKNIFTLIFILISINFTWSQSLCPPNGITTNPDSPNNSQNSAMKNDFFDWRVEDFNNEESFFSAKSRKLLKRIDSS